MNTIGVIGYGNMGSAISQRLKLKYKVLVFDKDGLKTKNKGIDIAGNCADLARQADLLVLAIKPQDFDSVLAEIKKQAVGKLVISIAAGISTAYIENKLGKVRVVRAMPNLPAKIGQGMICLCKGKFASDSDLDFARNLFGNLGKTMQIEEEMMNAVTAISGSGPGFFYYLIQNQQEDEWQKYAQQVFMPQLSASAEKLGFSHEQALLLAKATTVGSVALLKQAGLSANELCRQVASQGGTTEAGLKKINDIMSLPDATAAALKRAEELSKKE